MTEIPSCSYECDRPECIRAQRDELVSRMTAETSNARGSCYEGVCPDCNSLDCDCDAPLPSRRPAMTGKPIDEEAVAQVCDRMLTAAIGKDWRKRAPEAVTAFWMGEVREALQEAVRALTAAQQQGQAVAYIEHSADKSSAVHMTQAGMQLGIGRHACYTAAPPSAPVAADWITGDGLQGIKAEAHFLTQHADETVQRVGRRLIERVDKIIAALAQQPAAVDEAMVERAWVAFCENNGSARQGIRAALTAALATQRQEPTT